MLLLGIVLLAITTSVLHLGVWLSNEANDAPGLKLFIVWLYFILVILIIGAR